MSMTSSIAGMFPTMGRLFAPKYSPQLSTVIVNRENHFLPRNSLVGVNKNRLLKVRVKPILMKDSVRPMSDRIECEKPKESKCKKLKPGCPDTKKSSKAKESASKYTFTSMWETRTCCESETCPEIYRADIYHYKLEDKTKVKYPRTWWECSEYKFGKKPSCIPEEVDLPPMPRRERKPHTARKYIEDECPPEKKALKCPRTNIPGCSGKQVKCSRTRLATDCTKLNVPCPAFSECQKDPPRPVRPNECDCNDTPPQCLAFRYMKEHGKMNKY